MKGLWKKKKEMKNTVLCVIAVKWHVSSYEQSEKRERKKKEKNRNEYHHKLLHQTRATFFPAGHSISISVADLADSRSITAFFLLCRITVPLSTFASHLCCLKFLRTRPKKHSRFRQPASHRASLAPPPLESGLLMDSVK